MESSRSFCTGRLGEDGQLLGVRRQGAAGYGAPLTVAAPRRLAACRPPWQCSSSFGGEELWCRAARRTTTAPRRRPPPSRPPLSCPAPSPAALDEDRRQLDLDGEPGNELSLRHGQREQCLTELARLAQVHGHGSSVGVTDSQCGPFYSATVSASTPLPLIWLPAVTLTRINGEA